MSYTKIHLSLLDNVYLVVTTLDHAMLLHECVNVFKNLHCKISLTQTLNFCAYGLCYEFAIKNGLSVLEFYVSQITLPQPTRILNYVVS